MAIIAVNCSDQEKTTPLTIAQGWEIKGHYGDGKYENKQLQLSPGGGILFIGRYKS